MGDGYDWQSWSFGALLCCVFVGQQLPSSLSDEMWFITHLSTFSDPCSIRVESKFNGVVVLLRECNAVISACLPSPNLSFLFARMWIFKGRCSIGLLDSRCFHIMFKFQSKFWSAKAAFAE